METTLFDTVHEKDYLKFGDNSASNVVKFLKFSKSEVANLTGVTANSVRYDEKIPVEVKDRLEEIAVICQLVAKHFKGNADKTALWFRTTNPFLGGVSPRDMIRIGKYKKLMQFIMDVPRGKKA
jgi:hypothetical protein